MHFSMLAIHRAVQNRYDESGMRYMRRKDAHKQYHNETVH